MIGNVDLKLSYDTKIDETMSTEEENKDFNATIGNIVLAVRASPLLEVYKFNNKKNGTLFL